MTAEEYSGGDTQQIIQPDDRRFGSTHVIRPQAGTAGERSSPASSLFTPSDSLFLGEVSLIRLKNSLFR
jgi:hypothetical protein